MDGRIIALICILAPIVFLLIWLDKRIKQLKFDCEDFKESVRIVLEDRDKQVMKVRRLEDRIDKIQAKVDEQAEDEGLWFNHKYITEDYLQRAIRELHKVVEEK